jgi:hypothetical protein
MVEMKRERFWRLRKKGTLGNLNGKRKRNNQGLGSGEQWSTHS